MENFNEEVLSEVSGGAEGIATFKYTIVYGDTLGEIAQRFGTTVQILCRLNSIANPDKIKAGDTIDVPESKKTGWL